MENKPKKAPARKEKFTNTLVEKLAPSGVVYDVNDTEVPGLLVRVHPSGTKIFYVRYRADKKQRYYRLCNAGAVPVAEARLAAKQYLADVTKGHDPQAIKHRPKDLTLEEFLKVYKGEATRKWHIEAEARVRRCFKDLLPVPLGEITDKPIKQYRNRRTNDETAGGTINRDIAALRGVLSRAVEAGHLEKNPLVSKSLKDLPEDSGSMPRYLQPEELKRLHEALAAREAEMVQKRTSFNDWRRDRNMSTFPELDGLAFVDHLRPMTLLALNTGLRRGEIFNLAWADCTLKSAAPSLVVHGKGSKSGKTRHVPLNRPALDTLTKWKEQTDSDGLVFPSPVTGARFDNINTAWREVVSKAQLPGFKFHDTRHHFASMLVQKGVDLNVVRELLGHADLKLTMRYAHLAPHNAAAAVALLALPENVIPMKRTSK